MVLRLDDIEAFLDLALQVPATQVTGNKNAHWARPIPSIDCLGAMEVRAGRSPAARPGLFLLALAGLLGDWVLWVW